MSKKEKSELVSNRRAFYEYEILETFEAGIVLFGTEVKSLRNHGGSLQDSYILINDKDEVILKNASIAPYRFGNLFNHAEKRERKLLLHKREIHQLKILSQQKNLTLIPLSIYLNKGFIKAKIASVRGKKTYDKRSALKERDQKKEIHRAMKDF